MRRRLLLGSLMGIAVLLGAGIGQPRGTAAPAIGTLELSHGWALRSEADVPDGGAAISRVGYATPGWYPISLPSTVLAGLVANHVYRNVYFGLNLQSVPDLTREQWWFRGEFRA